MPGLDRLGLAFYQAAWGAASGDLQLLFDAFFDSVLDLEPINRAYIALLPQGVPTPTPGSFCPVSLQNGGVKILFRGLTSHYPAAEADWWGDQY